MRLVKFGIGIQFSTTLRELNDTPEDCLYRTRALCAAAIALLSASDFAHAKDGYFSHGLGIKSEGIAGVGIAFPQDSLAAATNPAGTALVGNRVDLGAWRPVSCSST